MTAGGPKEGNDARRIAIDRLAGGTMILCDHINEKQLVSKFIEETKRHPINVNGQLKNWFIWGAEIWLPEGGCDGFSGALDIIATDEDGYVWLIEAKLRTNPELSPEIWKRQLLPYRRGLARLSADTVNRRSRRYLINQGEIELVRSDVGKVYRHLFDAFCEWAKSLGFGSERAKQLYNDTLQAVQDENVICTVLADIFSMDVWLARPQDGKPYSYIYTENNSNGFDIRLVLEYPNSIQKQVVEDYSETVREWADLARHKQAVKPTPQTVELYLTNESAAYYRECIQHLITYGWNGKFHSNSKAFTVDMPTIYGPSIRIHLGWVDFDARVPMKNRLPGELGLKFNIDFRHFNKSGERKIGYELARKLAKEAHYNGRGKGLFLQKRDLTEDEQESWDWEMYRYINPFDRDYLGNPQEKKDFEAAWVFLSKVLLAKERN